MKLSTHTAYAETQFFPTAPVMTEKAAGKTKDDMNKEGYADLILIKEGYMTQHNGVDFTTRIYSREGGAPLEVNHGNAATEDEARTEAYAWVQSVANNYLKEA